MIDISLTRCHAKTQEAKHLSSLTLTEMSKLRYDRILLDLHFPFLL